MIDLATLISRAAHWYGDHEAVSDARRRLSFREVEERSNRLAHGLLELSPTPGAPVALLMPNRAEFIECDFAIIKSGKVKVPINTRLVDDERAYILENSGAETVIVDAMYTPFVEDIRPRLPQLRQVITLDHHYEDWLAQGATTPPVPQPLLDPDAPSFMLYTSGTTGRPKGAVSTNRGRMAATLNMWAEELDVRAGDAMVHVGSMAHGSGSKTLAYFLRGARNIAVDKWEPDHFLTLVERERATASFMVPTMVIAMVEAAGRARSNGSDLSTLRTISYGGAPFAPAALERALQEMGSIFVQVYGSCEAPHPVSVLRKHEHRIGADDHRRRHLASIGREVAQVEVRIASDNGHEQPIGERGEMWIRGPAVMSGYWRNPEATADAFVDGWYRSGDVAMRDDDGYLYIVDRARDLIITGGYNVYPAEVEAAIHRHPAVLETAVIGVPDDVWGESVKAFVVLRPGPAQPTPDDLVEHCRQHLAGYKKPKDIEVVAELPKGSTGKILKRELRDAAWAGRDRAV